MGSIQFITNKINNLVFSLYKCLSFFTSFHSKLATLNQKCGSQQQLLTNYVRCSQFIIIFLLLPLKTRSTAFAWKFNVTIIAFFAICPKVIKNSGWICWVLPLIKISTDACRHFTNEIVIVQ